MFDIKAKLGFAFVVSFFLFGLILVGQSDALKNPDSLVAAWMLDGDASDSSGNGYDGELTGGGEWMSGMHGMAVVFSNLGDTIQITDFANHVPTEEITIIVWARVDVVQNQDLFSFDPLEINGGRITAHLPWVDAGSAVIWQFGPNGIGAGGIDDSHIGLWEHWAFIHSAAGNYMRVLRNGEQSGMAEMSGTFIHGDGTFHIGGRPGSSFAGAIDDFAIFNTVLGDDEIMALMNDGLMAHIGGGPTAVESSGKAATTWAHLKALK
ncbi:MAG: hypothetical protein OXP71_17880 [Candidatus Poribacteria bacterium]|nr:hypothetical protein [Candidatus Poribacteria bacterium]